MTVAAMSKPRQGTRHGGALKLHRRATFGEVSIAPRQPQSPVSPTIFDAGTPLAIKYITTGVPALLPRKPGRGGARNRATRETHALTAAQIANLLSAARHADLIGLPLTRMVTIHWEAAGVPLVGMAKATGRFTDLLTKALARHGSRTAWLWTHEGGEGKGGHLHLLAHVPADLVPVLSKLQRGWLRRITGKPYRARVIHSEPIGGRLGIEVGNPAVHAVNLDAALGYVLKGASKDATCWAGLGRLEPSGRVIGKRCGTSQNIGAKARKARG